MFGFCSKTTALAKLSQHHNFHVIGTQHTYIKNFFSFLGKSKYTRDFRFVMLHHWPDVKEIRAHEHILFGQVCLSI